MALADLIVTIKVTRLGILRFGINTEIDHSTNFDTWLTMSSFSLMRFGVSNKFCDERLADRHNGDDPR